MLPESAEHLEMLSPSPEHFILSFEVRSQSIHLYCFCLVFGKKIESLTVAKGLNLDAKNVGEDWKMDSQIRRL